MKNNKGSSVIEACIVIPLFLFFMLFVIFLYRMIYVDAHIHQSLCESAVYCAERLYLEDRLMEKNGYGTEGNEQIIKDGNREENNNNRNNIEQHSTVNIGVTTGIIYSKFHKYMANDPVVSQVVAGGQKGIVITIIPDKKDSKTFIAKATYMTKIDIPIIGSYMYPRSNEVKQKAFLGYNGEDAVDENDVYVYVTPNESVFHLNRSCSHLTRSVKAVTRHTGYEPCSFCGKGGEDAKVYVTDNGKVYHYNPDCSGLKRTVIRVKKKDLTGLSVCSRCGKYSNN